MNHIIDSFELIGAALLEQSQRSSSFFIQNDVKFLKCNSRENQTMLPADFLILKHAAMNIVKILTATTTQIQDGHAALTYQMVLRLFFFPKNNEGFSDAALLLLLFHELLEYTYPI